MLLIIDNYDSFTYNLYHYFGELGYKAHVHRNDEIAVDRPQKLWRLIEVVVVVD